MEADDEPELGYDNPLVIEKTKLAATIANGVLTLLIAKVKVGARIVDLCAAGDEAIVAEAAKHYTKKKDMRKGIAFPTCISVNNVVGHFCPATKDDKTAPLAEGDLVKIDLGVHVDGYISTVAHTVIATDKPTEAVTGKKADVICAAFFAGEAALRLLRPGHNNQEVTDAIGKVAASFGVNVVEAVLSHRLKRYQLDNEEVILSRETADNHVDTVQFEDSQCWSIDIIMSTGEGKPKLGDAKTSVYKRAADEKYSLKQASSRELLNHIGKVYDTLAFSQRSVREVVGSKALLALKEMTEHSMLHEYPVLYEKKNDFVAQFKFTVLILPAKIEKLNAAPLPFVSSTLKVEDPSVQAILELPLVKKKAAAAPAAAAAAAAPAAATAPAAEKK